MRTLEELGQLQSIDEFTDEERKYFEEETREWFANVVELLGGTDRMRDIKVSPAAFAEHVQRKEKNDVRK